MKAKPGSSKDPMGQLGEVVVLRCLECGGLVVELQVLPCPFGLAIKCLDVGCRATAILSPTAKGMWRNQKA